MQYEFVGDVQESQQNIQSIFEGIQSEGYDKANMWQSLAKKPVLVSIVHFATNEKEEIVSRLCATSVVCVSANKQDEIDNDEGKADVDMKVNGENIGLENLEIGKEQFVNETDLIEAQFEDKWEQLLNQIQEFDKNYKRPKKLGYMSEKERLGNFSGIHAMFTLHSFTLHIEYHKKYVNVICMN